MGSAFDLYNVVHDPRLLFNYARSIPPTYTLTTVLGFLFAAYFSTYILVSIVAHQPRPETASERTYRSISADGLPTGPQLLPDAFLPALAPTLEVSVIVPAFNERERLPVMLDEAVTFLHSVYGPILPHAPSGRGWEILIVDDSSTDSTPAVALAWTASRLAKHGDIAPGQIRVVTLERNRGKGGAVAHGMRHIRGRYAVFADADGASKFSDLAALMAALRAPGVEREEYGMAVGSRAHMSTTDGIVVQRSFVRNMLMYSFHLLLRIVGVRGIKDTQCGFKLFSRPAVRALFSDLKTERWIFDIEVLLLAGYKGVPIVEVPISWHEVAGTKMDLVRDSIRMAWDLVVVRLGYAVGVYQVGSLGPGKA